MATATAADGIKTKELGLAPIFGLPEAHFWIFCIKGDAGDFIDRNFVARNNNFNQPATCVHIYSLRYCYSRYFGDERQKILSKHL